MIFARQTLEKQDNTYEQRGRGRGGDFCPCRCRHYHCRCEGYMYSLMCMYICLMCTYMYVQFNTTRNKVFPSAAIHRRKPQPTSGRVTKIVADDIEESTSRILSPTWIMSTTGKFNWGTLQHVADNYCGMESQKASMTCASGNTLNIILLLFILSLFQLI